MRIGIVTDIHFGPAPMYFGKNRLMAAEAPRVLPHVLEQLKEQNPDVVFQLGDLIHEDMKHASVVQDRDNYQKALAHFDIFNVPVFHLLGNHDVVTLKKNDFKELLGYELPYYSFDLAGYHFVCLFSDPTTDKGIYIEDAQLQWLASDLQNTTLPTVIFVHHPLVEQPLENHYWFNGEPQRAFVQNSSAVRQLIFDSKNVILVCNGHMHENRYAIVKNIPFVTFQGLVEDIQNSNTPSACFGVVDFKKDEGIEISVHGADPARYYFSSQ